MGAAGAGLLCASGLRAGPPTEQQVRSTVEEVYQRPEFSLQSSSNIFKIISQWLGDFFHWLGSLQDANPVLYWILLLSLSALLALLITHLTWTIRRVLFVGEGARKLALEKQQRLHLSQEYLQAARQRAGEGDFTEAIRCLFLSLIYYFDESGRIHFQDSYTNREYLALFTDRQPVHDALAVFVDVLDDYWYGQRPADRRQFDECLVRFESLK